MPYRLPAGCGKKTNPCWDSRRVWASSERARGKKATAKDQPKGTLRGTCWTCWTDLNEWENLTLNTWPCYLQGTISVGIDATDLFDRYEEDYEDMVGGGVPHLEINKMHISQSIEVLVGFHLDFLTCFFFFECGWKSRSCHFRLPSLLQTRLFCLVPCRLTTETEVVPLTWPWEESRQLTAGERSDCCAVCWCVTRQRHRPNVWNRLCVCVSTGGARSRWHPWTSLWDEDIPQSNTTMVGVESRWKVSLFCVSASLYNFPFWISFVTAQCGLQFSSRGVRPGFTTVLARHLDKNTMGYLQWRWGIQSSMNTSIVRDTKSSHFTFAMQVSSQQS